MVRSGLWRKAWLPPAGSLRMLQAIVYRGLLFQSVPARAIWPFSGGGNEIQQDEDVGDVILGPGIMAGPMVLTPFGPATIIADGQFGFDPWEDLHANVERVVTEESQSRGRRGSRGRFYGPGDDIGEAARPLEAQLGNLLQAFGGDHAGQLGRAEGSFQVDEDKKRGFRISAKLPGYKLDASDLASSPLTVRVVGKRSLVITGTQQDGFVVEEWQRSFKLPRNSDTDKAAVTYNGTDGNLTVVVPQRADQSPNGEKEEAAEEEEEEDDMGFDTFLPPAFRALQQGLPEILQQIAADDGKHRARLRGGSGFLMPFEEDSFGNGVADMLGQLHPRFHPPPGGEQEVPDSAEVNLIGCFEESQLAKAELKYYGETNAASFAAMFWHAQADAVPYFAMARHGDALGHAFTFRNFTHEKEQPKWGVYDDCGSRCEDDETRWCGCANEPTRGMPNQDCSSADGEKRFAVYKAMPMKPAPSAAAAASPIAQPDASSKQVEGSEAEKEASQPAQSTADSDGQQQGRERRPAEARPYWQLSKGTGEEGPSLEIVAPRGTVAKAAGREVLLYNATTGQVSSVQGVAEGEGAASMDVADEADEVRSSDSEGVVTSADGQRPLGKFRLPVDIAPEQCAMEGDPSQPSSGGQVLKCRLEQNDVKVLPINVVSDEL